MKDPKKVLSALHEMLCKSQQLDKQSRVSPWTDLCTAHAIRATRLHSGPVRMRHQEQSHMDVTGPASACMHWHVCRAGVQLRASKAGAHTWSRMADLVMGTALSDTAWPAGLIVESAADLAAGPAFSLTALPAGRMA